MMTLSEIYKLAIEMGIKTDPRGEKEVRSLMKSWEKEYKDLSPKQKKYFDTEMFVNPFSDSRIMFGEASQKISQVTAGIDANPAEILLADRLTEKGKKIDLVIGHHPVGHGLAGMHDVMDVQVDMYEQAGVPVNVAHGMFESRKKEVSEYMSPLNLFQTVDTARLLDMPLLILHTIWDNIGHDFLSRMLAKKSYRTVGEILEDVLEIPEFIASSKVKNGPSIASGSEKSRAGKVVVSFTGGTNPSKELYLEMAKAGVGTLVEMHVPQDALKELRKLHINVIDCGHMAADSIGANIFLDEIEKRGVTVIPSSGLMRVKRGNSK